MWKSGQDAVANLTLGIGESGKGERYTRAAALFRDLALARADGSLRNLLAGFGRTDVLVIDDWAMAPLSVSQRRDFWDSRGSLSGPLADPHVAVAGRSMGMSKSAKPTAADGILDRLVTMLTESRCVALDAQDGKPNA
jgi:hypothetical protein